jgi:hypothetical protein
VGTGVSTSASSGVLREDRAARRPAPNIHRHTIVDIHKSARAISCIASQIAFPRLSDRGTQKFNQKIQQIVEKIQDNPLVSFPLLFFFRNVPPGSSVLLSEKTNPVGSTGQIHQRGIAQHNPQK